MLYIFSSISVQTKIDSYVNQMSSWTWLLVVDGVAYVCHSWIEFHPQGQFLDGER